MMGTAEKPQNRDSCHGWLVSSGVDELRGTREHLRAVRCL